MQQPLITYEREILEAIDQLRRRKARPDSNRICNYLLRRYSVDAQDTISDLQQLIKVEKVIPVDYKGRISHRNASTWPRLQLHQNKSTPPQRLSQQHQGLPNSNSHKKKKRKLNLDTVQSAISELVIAEPDYLYQGVPSDRLIEQILDILEHTPNPNSLRVLATFLDRQVDNGNLTRLPNNCYTLVSATDMHDEDNPIQQEQPSTSHQLSTTVAAVQEVKQRLSPYHFDDTEEGQTSSDSVMSEPKFSKAAAGAEISPEAEISSGVIIKVEVKKEDIKEQQATAMRKVEKEVEIKKEAMPQAPTPLTPKKAGKSERKQKLQVRRDDAIDVEIKFEDIVQGVIKKGAAMPEKKVEDYEKFNHKEEEIERYNNERVYQSIRRNRSPTSPNNRNDNLSGARSVRRKRAKKVFDPSDNNLVKRKRAKYGSAQNKIATSIPESQEVQKLMVKDGPNRECSICSKNKPEALIACRDCTVRAHPSCMSRPDEMLHKMINGWQCSRCKSCVVCCETSESGSMIMCINCGDAYHHICHTPSVNANKSAAKWHCSQCANSNSHCKTGGKINNNNNSNSYNSSASSRAESPNAPVLSPQISPILPSSQTSSSAIVNTITANSTPTTATVMTTTRSDLTDRDSSSPKDPFKEKVPDASNWTCEQVYQYFARFFPQQAESFRNYDIDGHSLLLMKRSDILTGMELRLGPALKIYRHVVRLQLGKDDPQHYWL